MSLEKKPSNHLELALTATNNLKTPFVEAFNLSPGLRKAIQTILLPLSRRMFGEFNCER